MSPFRCAMSVTTSVCTLTTHVECSRQNATTPCSCSLHVNNNILYSSRRNIKMPRLPAVVRFTSKCPHSLQLFASRQNIPTPYRCSLHVKIPPLATAVRFTSKCLHSLQLFASRQNIPTPYRCSLHVKIPPLATAVRFTPKCLHSLQLFASRQNVSTPCSCSLASFTARGALQKKEKKKNLQSRNVGKQAVGFAKRLCILSEATVLGLFGS